MVILLHPTVHKPRRRNGASAINLPESLGSGSELDCGRNSVVGVATRCGLGGSGLPRVCKGNTSEDDRILIRTSEHLKMSLEIEPDAIWPGWLKLEISVRPGF